VRLDISDISGPSGEAGAYGVTVTII
jgi:hypothetical protein